MQFTSIVESLLFEHESDSLDFKQEQYRFNNHASDEDKSKLLKDILAFTNAWRRSDAYIVVGAQEVKGARAHVLGITEHIDDAHLQQFVNLKTNTPVELSYATVPIDGKTVGLIRIPVQARPVYLNKRFGDVQANTVYVRRGSSTEIATPSEIAKMGLENVSGVAQMPTLEVFLVKGKDHELTQKATCKLIHYSGPSPEEIPDYGDNSGDLSFAIPRLYSHDFLSNDNPDFYRERAKYLQARAQVERFRFAVLNKGTIVARDVQLLLLVKEDKTTFVHTKGVLPNEPEREKNPIRFFPDAVSKSDVSVEMTKAGWQVKAYLGKIQPKQEVITFDAMFIGSAIAKKLSLEAKVFSDDLPEPITQVFNIAFEIEKRVLSVNALKGLRSA